MMNIGDTVTVTKPCSGGLQVRARYLGGDQYQGGGNTNGHTVDTWSWLAWAIRNKKIKAAASWATRESLHQWGEAHTYGNSLVNRLAPPLIEFVVAAAATYGLAETGAVAASGASGPAALAVPGSGTLAQPIALSNLTIEAPASAAGLTAPTAAAGTAAAAGAGSGSGSSLSNFLFGANPPTLAKVATDAGTLLAVAGASSPSKKQGPGVSPARAVPASSPFGWIVLLLGAAGALLLAVG